MVYLLQSYDINTWLEQMKTDLIDLGFACLPTTGNDDVEGEL